MPALYQFLPSTRLVRFAALFVCLTATAARAADVYFPATTAYDRRNYDPFDQSAAAIQPTSSTPITADHQSTELGDVQFTSDVRLLGADPFQHSSPIIQTALQPVGPAAAEPLPMPDGASPHGAPVNEPGADWSPKPLSELTTNTVLPGGVLPRDYWSERTPQHVAFFDACGTTRGWPVHSFNWVASCLCHNPLYFEEVNLERYGYGCGCCGPCCSTGVQSLCSAAHFFGTVVALPYEMGVDCPMECDYTLGHYRPGSCPPYRYHCCTRCSATGGLSAGAVATGLIFLIP